MTIIVPARNMLLATILNEDDGFKKANRRMETPQMIYPKDINIFLLPSLSLTAPINNVVMVAVAALAITIQVMKS